jgi:hypothetical protein
MSKPKVTPTEFPVTIDGKVCWVKKGDYSKAVSSQAAIKYAVDVKRDHITQMIEAIEGGKTEMGGDTPDEFQKIFEAVKKDYNAAVAEVERKDREKAEATAKEEQEKKDKEAGEIALFEKSKGLTTDFVSLSSMFDTGGENMDRFVAKDGATDDDLLAAFKASLKMGEFTGWMKGDLVVQLEDRGHINVCTRIAEDMGVPFPSIYRMARTARAVPPAKRVKGVNFTTYSEIANAKLADKKEEQEAKLSYLLKGAEEGKFKTALETRAAVKTAQGKVPPPVLTPEESPKNKFLVFDLEAESGKEVSLTIGFPKKAQAEGCIIVDLKTGKRFAENGFRKDAAKRWLELEEVKQLTAEEEEAAKKAEEAEAKKAADAAAAKAAKKAKGKKVAA